MLQRGQKVSALIAAFTFAQGSRMKAVWLHLCFLGVENAQEVASELRKVLHFFFLMEVSTHFITSYVILYKTHTMKFNLFNELKNSTPMCNSGKTITNTPGNFYSHCTHPSLRRAMQRILSFRSFTSTSSSLTSCKEKKR